MTTPELSLELLGGLRLRQNEKLLCEFPPQQSGMLLAYLALHAGRALTREEVIAWLAPDLEIEAGRHKLRQYLYGLRRELSACSLADEHLLLITRNQIGLNPESVNTDVAAFVAMVRAATDASDVTERVRLLTVANALYRGELLLGFYDDAFEAERRRLTEMHYNALLMLATAHREAGDLTQALEVAQRLIALDPLHEDAYCEAMRIYAESGRFTAALRIYQRLTETLKRELDVDPSPEAQRLMQTLRINANKSDIELVNGAATPLPIDAPASSPAPAAEPASYIPQPTLVSAPPSPPPHAIPGKYRHGRMRLMPVIAMVIALIALVWNLPTMRHKAAPAPTPVDTNVGPASGPAFNAGLAGVYGKEGWVRYLEERPGDGGSEPTAMTTDELGNLYITGFVHTGKHDVVDYVTLKVAGNGAQLWQSRYNGPANDCDRARSIAVDRAGNVYVTGDSYNGDWDKGGTDYDVATIKYDVNGKPSATWPDTGSGVGVRRYDCARRADWGKKIALDSAGNVYVGATSVWVTAHGAPCSDFVILKYDANGNRKWCRRYNSTGNSVDELTDLAVDGAGNVTVIGNGRGSGHSVIVTAQYDAAGKRRWIQTYDGPGNGEKAGSRVALDRSGDIYIAGYTDMGPAPLGGLQMHIVTLKYSGNGAVKWCQIDPTGWRVSKPNAIAVDAAGNVTVAGVAGNGTSGMRILSYDANGFVRWGRSISGGAPNGSEDPYNMAHGVVLERDGGMFVTGSLHNGPGAGDDYATLHLDVNGAQSGFFLYDDPFHGVDIGAMLAMGPKNLYVVGQAEGRSHRSITILMYQL